MAAAVCWQRSSGLATTAVRGSGASRAATASAWARPRSSRASPAVQPAKTGPVIAVRPCRTSRTVVTGLQAVAVLRRAGGGQTKRRDRGLRRLRGGQTAGGTPVPGRGGVGRSRAGGLRLGGAARAHRGRVRGRRPAVQPAPVGGRGRHSRPPAC